MRLYRKILLFLGIVWRQWDQGPPREYCDPYRLSVRDAWDIAGIVWAKEMGQ